MSEFVEQSANPEPAAQAVTGTGTEDTELQSLLTQPDPDADPDATLASDDSEEIDYEGEKYKVPAKLKDAFMRHRDYTEKTMTAAEERRAFEQQRTSEKAALEQQQARFKEQAEFHQKHIKDVATVVSIDERLAQFAGLDWDAITTADPVQAMKLERQVRELQSARQEALNKITQAQHAQNLEKQQLTARQAEQIAKQTEAARRELERDIPGWSGELASKLKAYGHSQGYAPEVLDNVANPGFVKTLHKAYLYDQLVSKSKAKPNAEPAKPVTRVGGAGAAASAKKLSDMSTKDFIAERQKYIQKHR